MLVDPHANDSSRLRVVGIDPGSTTLGVAVIEYDLEKDAIVSSAAITLNADKMTTSETDESVHSYRYARIFALGDALVDLFHECRPLLIACESPFMSRRRPMAYGALMETVYAIRLSVRTFDPTMSLDLVDPPTAKIAVGAKGNAGKEDVLKAIVSKREQLCFNASLSSHALEALDEHSSDAIAIAYWRLKQYLNN